MACFELFLKEGGGELGNLNTIISLKFTKNLEREERNFTDSEPVKNKMLRDICTKSRWNKPRSCNIRRTQFLPKLYVVYINE